ncbi:MAG TPA: sodium:solute symporter family protein [Candidatus Angelobacter sp.]|nr:sodium:solute symporter family protein [Candidatus Angelobacter sp.]
MNLYAIVLTVIVVVLLTVSISQIRKVKTKADYLVAGRTLPWYVLVFTLLSSWIGSGSLFGGAENAFKNGFPALWQPAGGWVGLLVILVVAPRARKFAQFTVPDLLETRYNTAARVLGAIAILFAFTAITSYQFKGGGDVLHLTFPGLDQIARDTFHFAPGHEHRLGMVIIAVFVIVFTALAGMASVAYLDVVIGLLATVMCLAAIPILSNAVGGWSGLQQKLPADHFQFLGPFTFVKAMEYFMPVFLLMLGNQAMYQKFFSAKSERDAKIAVFGWIGGTLILETVIVAIAVFGAALYGNTDVAHAPREIIPYTARHGLPAVMGALLMGAVFAKVISTANNYLFSPATNLVHDVYSRFVNKNASDSQILLVSRIIVVGLGIFALLQGTIWESILAMALYAYTIYSAAITPAVMAAFFSKRVTAPAAVTSIVLGTVITIAWNIMQLASQSGNSSLAGATWLQHDAIFPALAVSLVSLVGVSLVTAPPRPEQWKPFLANENVEATAKA